MEPDPTLPKLPLRMAGGAKQGISADMGDLDSWLRVLVLPSFIEVRLGRVDDWLRVVVLPPKRPVPMPLASYGVGFEDGLKLLVLATLTPCICIAGIDDFFFSVARGARTGGEPAIGRGDSIRGDSRSVSTEARGMAMGFCRGTFRAALGLVRSGDASRSLASVDIRGGKGGLDVAAGSCRALLPPNIPNRFHRPDFAFVAAPESGPCASTVVVWPRSATGGSHSCSKRTLDCCDGLFVAGPMPMSKLSSGCRTVLGENMMVLSNSDGPSSLDPTCQSSDIL
jgi:hypothetical protein